MYEVVALVDANNFYCSCERAFNASLQGKPVIVLSNNDGCVVARSNESKALGIKMGQPVFECRELIEQHGVQVFSSNYPLYADVSHRIMQVLKTFSSSVEVYSHLLQSRNIRTARDLKYANQRWIRKHLTVVGERTLLELRGVACIPLETQARPKKGIMTAKTFGKPVERLEELKEAVATYTARAAEKLRKQDSAASCISVFIHTNVFKKDIPQYSNSLSRVLHYPTSFTPDLLHVALEMVRNIYREGYFFSKAGVFIPKIVSQEVLQADLFGEYSIEREYKKARLMCVVDLLNQWWGSNTIFFGAQGIERVWKMRQERLSPRYTTRWGEIVVVRS